MKKIPKLACEVSPWGSQLASHSNSQFFKFGTRMICRAYFRLGGGSNNKKGKGPLLACPLRCLLAIIGGQKPPHSLWLRSPHLKKSGINKGFCSKIHIFKRMNYRSILTFRQDYQAVPPFQAYHALLFDAIAFLDHLSASSRKFL